MAIKYIKTQTEWEEEISIKILSQVKNELYIDYRFLNIALSALTPKKNDSLVSFATDGINIMYGANHVMSAFKNNPVFLNRAYLHTVLHCMFAHLWFRKKADKRLYDIACDMIVEFTIDNMDEPSTHRIIGWTRQRSYETIRKNELYSATLVYRWLKTLGPEEIDELYKEFFTDSHYYWPKDEDNKASVSEGLNKWNKIARQIKLEKKMRGNESGDGESLLFSQIKADKKKREYKEFLKKFMVRREELKCDLDEFDIGFYIYGLNVYKNMPLIEPIETKEVQKIQELVVVIDTSYSTSGELVKSFLKETFSIIKDEKSFFKNSIIRILQCDDKVHADDVITSVSQIDKLFEDYEIKGGGNTDFRPAFNYVNTLVEEKVISNLGGLLYFTDGKGIYPVKRPPYKAAFVFMEDNIPSDVPAWAIRLNLDKEDF